jgi:hypothetical protein
MMCTVWIAGRPDVTLTKTPLDAAAEFLKHHGSADE